MSKAQFNKLPKKELVDSLAKLSQDYSALQGRHNKAAKDNQVLAAEVKELKKGKDKLHKDLGRATEIIANFIAKNGVPKGMTAIFWVISRPKEIINLIKDLIDVFKYQQDKK